jgi:hypothetical protein
MNWEEHISKFNLPHAKLLYLIYYLSKTNALDKQQKIKLKEYVVLENEKIFQTLEDFENHHNIENLLEDFKNIYEEERKYSFNRVEDETYLTTNDNKNVQDVRAY